HASASGASAKSTAPTSKTKINRYGSLSNCINWLNPNQRTYRNSQFSSRQESAADPAECIHDANRQPVAQRLPGVRSIPIHRDCIAGLLACWASATSSDDGNGIKM